MSARTTEVSSSADDVFRRRGLWASAATAAGVLFALVDYGPLNFAIVDGRIAVVLLLLAAAGATGAFLHRPFVLIGVGGILLLLAVVRMITYGRNDGLIGGGSSTASLFAGLGLAWVGIAIARSSDPSKPPGTRKN